MNNVILVEKRNVWGNERIYIKSEHANAIRNLTSKETIDQTDIKNLRDLGFEFQVMTPTL